MPRPFTRGRLSVKLSAVAYLAPGLQTLGNVESKGESRFLCVDPAGNYWACADGEAAIPLVKQKAQGAIAAESTGMRSPSQADRIAANAAMRESRALREAERLENKANSADGF